MAQFLAGVHPPHDFLSCYYSRNKRKHSRLRKAVYGSDAVDNFFRNFYYHHRGVVADSAL